MPALPAPDPGNYTFGAHEIIIDPAGTPVSLGNIVSANVAVELLTLSHFSARSGEDLEDASILRRTTFTIEATLDEPNKANMDLFFLNDGSGHVGKGSVTPKVIKFSGIPIVGNSFDWTIPKCIILPNGNFGYGTEDWTQFSLSIRVLPDLTAPTAPYGTLVHNGV